MPRETRIEAAVRCSAWFGRLVVAIRAGFGVCATPQVEGQSSRRGSNPRQVAYKADALPLSYGRGARTDVFHRVSSRPPFSRLDTAELRLTCRSYGAFRYAQRTLPDFSFAHNVVHNQSERQRILRVLVRFAALNAPYQTSIDIKVVLERRRVGACCVYPALALGVRGVVKAHLSVCCVRK